MKKTDLTSIALKMMGIYVLCQSLSLFQVAVMYFRFPSNFTEQHKITLTHAAAFGLPFLLTLIFGVVLIIFGSRIATRLFKRESETISTRFTAIEIQQVAFSAVGLLVLVNALPSLMATLSSYFVFKGGSTTLASPMLRDFWPEYVGLATRLVLGFWLFFGGKTLVLWLHKVTRKIWPPD